MPQISDKMGAVLQFKLKIKISAAHLPGLLHIKLRWSSWPVRKLTVCLFCMLRCSENARLELRSILWCVERMQRAWELFTQFAFKLNAQLRHNFKRHLVLFSYHHVLQVLFWMSTVIHNDLSRDKFISNWSLNHATTVRQQFCNKFLAIQLEQ